MGVIKKSLIKVIIGISYLYSYPLYRLAKKNKDRIRTWWISRFFSSVGADCRLGKIGALVNPQNIQLGNNVIFADYFYLTVFNEWSGKRVSGEKSNKIVIADNCTFGAFNHITAINSISIGEGCLTGKWVTITDNSHGNTSLEELGIRPDRRQLYSKGPVVIGKNVWIGDKATILPNVKIGEGAVVAANAVVTKDVPAYSVVAGIPAKVIERK